MATPPRTARARALSARLPVTLSIAMAAATLGCPWGTVTPEEFQQEFGIAATPGAKPDLNAFTAEGLGTCIAKLRAAVGEANVRATDLGVYPTYVLLTARSPSRPEDVDSYSCRQREVEPSVPVKLTEREVKELDDHTFTFSDVPFDLLPGLLQATPGKLGIEGGESTYVIIRRPPAPTDAKINVSVYVKGTRKDGYIDYDGQGAEVARNGKKPESAVMGADLRPAFQAIRDKLGPPPIRVTSIDLREHRVTLSAEHPTGSGKVVTVKYESGHALVVGTSPQPLDPARAYDLDEISLDVIARLLADAGGAEGRVSYILVEMPRDPSRGKGAKPTIRVYKPDGAPIYDLQGKPLRR